MSDEQIIALLTEIRDLQKQNAENYKIALQKQQEAMELQKLTAGEFKKRQKMVVMTVIAIMIVAFAIVALMPALIKGVNH